MPNLTDGVSQGGTPYTNQLAQSSAAGAVSDLAGAATVIRASGERESLQAGSPIFSDDTVETASGARLQITFNDGSTVGLGANGRLTIDSFVYDPAAGDGQMSVNFAQGLFSFTSGAIAKTGDEAMTMSTPVATIGIRGTSGIGQAAPEGVENYFVLLPDADGTLGEFSVRTGAGVEILNAPLSALTVSSAAAAPTTPEVFTLDQLQSRFPGIVELLSAYFSQIQRDQDAAPDDAESGDEEASGDGDQGNSGEDQDTDTADDSDATILQTAEEEFADLALASGTVDETGEESPENAFENQQNKTIDEDDDPSPFLNDLASTNNVSTFAIGTSTITTGVSFSTDADGDSPDGDSTTPPGSALSDGDGGASTVGGLAVIAAPVTGTVTRDGIDVVMRTPTSFFGGITGSSAFEQVVVDMQNSQTGSNPANVAIGQDAAGNVTIGGDGIGLALDGIEEVNLSMGPGADTVSVGALTNTDIAPSTVIIHGGDGDDTVTGAPIVGRNMEIFGGAGNDTLQGGDGDDSIFGGGQEFLQSDSHDWNIDAPLPVFGQGTRFDSTSASPGDDVNLTFDDGATVSLRFIGEGASSANSVGYYTFDADGTITGVGFVIENASVGSTPLQAGDTFSIDVPEGQTLGLFLLADGASLNDFSAFDDPNGRFEFRDANGDPATTGSTGMTLFYITETVDGNGQTVESAVAVNGTINYATLSSFNIGGVVGAYSGINPEHGALRLGFEDNPTGDLDYNDLVIELVSGPLDPDGSGNDTLIGGAGSDSLFGEDGNDVLLGGDGIDVLYGGSGDDVLVGGGGFDVLYGGTGADTFRYDNVSDAPAGGRDVIMDFEVGSDRIFLNNLLQGNFDVSVTETSNSVYDVTIDADGNGSTDITLEVHVTQGGSLDESHIVTAV